MVRTAKDCVKDCTKDCAKDCEGLREGLRKDCAAGILEAGICSAARGADDGLGKGAAGRCSARQRRR